MKTDALAALLALAFAASAAGAETVSFPSKDGLPITADLYLVHPDTAPFVLLFHQADWSRGEYLDIAPRLNALGFNAMAVDLRSGGEVKGVVNETAARARAAHRSTFYIDSLPDMEAAVAYAKAGRARGKLLLWGSSYSASLVLKIAGDDPSSCDAVLAFSPGEYFGRSGLIAASAGGIAVPAFIASSKYEEESWRPIFEAIPSPGKASFLPKASGAHGSRALWREGSGSEEYWKAVEAFLARIR
jgi:dienelactone hydrolase